MAASRRAPLAAACLPLLLLCLASSPVAAGPGRRRERTTTLAQDEALALQAASAAGVAAAGAVSLTTAAAVACPSGTFEWPAGTGNCWYKRDSNGAKQGPGSNVFKAANAAVNAADQLVLTVLYPKAPGSCGEVFHSRSLGYGDYIIVTATSPTQIDHRLVASPFIYADDTHEFDMEYSRWGIASSNNSQYVVQPYTTNAPMRFQVTATNVTHRIRWTPSSVAFESFAPEAAGGGLLATHTYAGSVGGAASNNFAPGAERFHFNYWIYSKANSLPSSSLFVVNCFKFCAQADLATCSTALLAKPRCSPMTAW